MEKKRVDSFIPMIAKMKKAFNSLLEKEYEESELEAVFFNAEKFFRQAREVLPDVSPSSPWLKNLIGITYEIGVWKELQKREMPLGDISVLNQKALALVFKDTIQPQTVTMMRDRLCSPAYAESIAADSKQREHPDDWLVECVYPKADDRFNIGMNIYRCPVKTLCVRLHAESYFPYLCLNDYITHGLFGVLLVRTQTLSHGADFCDFRLFALDSPVENIIFQPGLLAEFHAGPVHAVHGMDGEQ